MTQKCGFQLPGFCSFAPGKKRENGGMPYDDEAKIMMGWDITLRLSAFPAGIFLIDSQRQFESRKKDPKPYAEKLLYLREGQYSPMHFHWMEYYGIRRNILIIAIYLSFHQRGGIGPGDAGYGPCGRLRLYGGPRDADPLNARREHYDPAVFVP